MTLPAPNGFCHPFAMTPGNAGPWGGPDRSIAEHPNRPTSLTKSRKAAPRLKVRECLSASSNPAGVATQFETVEPGGPGDRPDPSRGVGGGAEGQGPRGRGIGTLHAWPVGRRSGRSGGRRAWPGRRSRRGPGRRPPWRASGGPRPGRLPGGGCGRCGGAALGTGSGDLLSARQAVPAPRSAGACAHGTTGAR